MPPRKRKASDPLVVPGGWKWMRPANGPWVAVNLHLHAPDEPQPDYVAASLSQALELTNSGGRSPKKGRRRLQPCFPPRPDEEHYWDDYYDRAVAEIRRAEEEKAEAEKEWTWEDYIIDPRERMEFRMQGKPRPTLEPRSPPRREVQEIWRGEEDEEDKEWTWEDYCLTDIDKMKFRLQGKPRPTLQDVQDCYLPRPEVQQIRRSEKEKEKEKERENTEAAKEVTVVLDCDGGEGSDSEFEADL